MRSCRNGPAHRIDLAFSSPGNVHRYRIRHPAETRIYGHRDGMVSAIPTGTSIFFLHSLQAEGSAFVQHRHLIRYRCRRQRRQHIPRLRRRYRRRRPHLEAA